AGIGAVRHSRQDDVAAFEQPTPGYTLVHANLAWHMDTASGNALELFVNGNNLLDRDARVHTSFLKDLAPLPGRGFTAGVRVLFERSRGAGGRVAGPFVGSARRCPNMASQVLVPVLACVHALSGPANARCLRTGPPQPRPALRR